jgi:hypothetical protein
MEAVLSGVAGSGFQHAGTDFSGTGCVVPQISILTGGSAMAIKQLKDLIEWITEYHELLEKKYESLADRQQDERMKMALQFLAGREHRQADAMEEFLQDADEDLMDLWLQNLQEFDQRNLSDKLPVCSGCESNLDILNYLGEAHKTLTDLYNNRAQLARNQRERALFQGLSINQQAEARLQTRDIGRLEMY